MKGFIAIIFIALAVSGAVSSHDRHEEEDMKKIMNAYALGHDIGYEQGTYNPAEDVRKELLDEGYEQGQLNPTAETYSQIHNKGYMLGQYWGTGQPIWIERNGWDRNDSIARFQDVDKIIVLANISTKDICITQGKPACGDNLNSYYKIIVKHYSGLGPQGWDAPEFVLDWERKP